MKEEEGGGGGGCLPPPAPFVEGMGAKNREIFRHEEKLFTISSLFIFISVIACSKPKGMVIPERLRKP